MRRNLFLIILVLSALSLNVLAAEKPSITLMTHDSFAISQDVLQQFEQRHGAEVKIIKSGDAGAALNQAILSKGNPLADVFFGVDNTFMSRALKAGIFTPHNASALQTIPQELKLDDKNRLLPVSYGDVCLNYDRAWFEARGIAPPKDLDDLIKPAYKGLTVVENPATSSPGMAFLLATVGRYGEDGYIEYWRQLRANDAYIANGWSDAYYGQFSRAKSGTRPIVVSYASSPAAEVFYSEQALSESPTAAVLSQQSAFRQIEFVGILKGTKQPELAAKLVDFMLSVDFQRDIPLNMWVFPANPEVELPEVFVKHTDKARQPVTLSPALIDQHRENWLQAWTEAVLR